MFEVATGSDKDVVERRRAIEAARLVGGYSYYFVPLNGGSDTRKDIREHYLSLAMALRLPALGRGDSVTVGWVLQRDDARVMRTLRGLRYVRDGNSVRYWHRRKLAREMRKNPGRYQVIA